ncbi:MAG: helix-turn-helix transcriptional regulator [Roseovarius sp.]|nr:helix-turn-helix transcriptional regulator [Roseovarius sp.]
MKDIAKVDAGSYKPDRGPAAELTVEALISTVGERVRKARERKGLPRRVLSEMSGVSPRYLAQLEAGEGNISIGLLQRVALALDHRIEWLVSEEDPWTSEVVRVGDLYRTASPETRARVLELLSHEPPERMRARRICLIGLSGAGKSTLGALVARDLKIPLVELNSEIERHSGMSLDEILALYGHDGYRRLEKQALDRVIENYEEAVLAVAGGIVAEPETYKTLLARFHTVWLKTSPEEHMARVRDQGALSPVADHPEVSDQLRAILASWQALYEQAPGCVETSGKPADAAHRELVALLRDWSLTEDGAG